MMHGQKYIKLYNAVVNRTTCFGLFRGHHQVLRLLAIGGQYKL